MSLYLVRHGQTEFKVLDKVTSRDGTLSTRATWVVPNGETRLVKG